MNLGELYNWLKNTEQLISKLVYVEQLNSSAVDSKYLLNEKLIQTLTNQHVIIQNPLTDLPIVNNYILLGSTLYLKDGADGANTFIEFVDFIEGKRAGKREIEEG